MKRSTILLGLLIALAISCKDDDADEKNGGYSFKDQDLGGMIGGVLWTQRSGFAQEESYNGEEILGIDLVETVSSGEGCTMFMPEGDYVFFDVPNKVGLYELSINWDADLANSTEKSRTVTLYDGDDKDKINYIATSGAIEILSISETEITGRIDARAEEGTYVNGNFTVALCK